MRRATIQFLALVLLLPPAAEARTRGKKTPAPPRAAATQYKGCESLCADLNASIQRHPERLAMWLEDALVIREACVADIVAAAIDAVGNDPEKVRFILDTALHVAPSREAQILLAARQFRVPAAGTVVEPVEEIRRAVVPAPPTPPETPAGTDGAAIEVRRALQVERTEPTPIIEIRRAVVPVTASVGGSTGEKAR